ncbi:MAG: PqqD family protein [Gammaproteobacteria bacterium]|nr:PqqD family protein [Gammaproteobacteria bacterium]
MNDLCSIYPARRPEVVLYGAPGRYHLYDEKRLATIHINDTTAAIWQLCNRALSVDTIIDLLSQAYNEPRTEITSDIQKILNGLREQQTIYLYKDCYKLNPTIAADINYHDISPILLETLESFRKQFINMFPDDRTVGSAPLDISALEQEKTKQSTHSSAVMFNTLHKVKDEHSEILLDQIRAELDKIIPTYGVNRTASGQVLYGAGSWLSWHTNEDKPGRRVYCNWSEKADTNFFRYLNPDNGEIITEMEPAGWSVKSFYIPAPPEQLWHCLNAGSKRIGLGFAEYRYKRIDRIER